MLQSQIMHTFNHVGNSLEELVTENINGSRHYVVGTKKYPSITTILGKNPEKINSINQWKKRVGEEKANKISSKAMRTGSAVHKMVEDYINNSFDSSAGHDYVSLDMFSPLMRILNNKIDNIHAQEVCLWSDYLQTAGRVDCVAEYNGRLSIIDFKTSRKPKKKEWIEDYFQQACAYSIMWEERTKTPITQLVVLISVADDSPQIFIEHRDDWAKRLLGSIDYYYKEYGNGIRSGF